MKARAAIRAGYLAAAAFIVLGPAIPQLAGLKSPALRAWQMFSGVGIGMLRGDFVIREGGIVTTRETALEFLGLERYPTGTSYRFTRLVLREGDLARISAPRCAAMAPDATLAFEGEIGVLEGWQPLAVDDICGGGQ